MTQYEVATSRKDFSPVEHEPRTSRASVLLPIFVPIFMPSGSTPTVFAPIKRRTVHARAGTFLIIGLFVSAVLVAGCSRTSNLIALEESDSDSLTVAVINGEKLEFAEFLDQYQRSASLAASESVDTLTAYQDFLERYVSYRLKVLEARSAGYENLDDLRTEIGQYRDQLARPYLLKNEVTEPLIREYYNRRKEMVSASHLLIRLGDSSTPSDTLEAFQRIASISDSVRSGVDFGDLAFRYSEDPSAAGLPGSPGYRGYLGFFGAGRMVGEFEDAAYKTTPGELSPIFRTQFGYHILYVHERRPFPDDIRIAHLMIRPTGSSPADSLAARSEIENLLRRIRQGEDFAALAAAHSADTRSAANGGELQRVSFDSGLPDTMRDAAFALSVGQVSEVVETPFGFHLIKLLEVFPGKSFEDTYEDMQTRISQLPRAKRAEDAWKRRMRARYEVGIDSTLLEKWVGFYRNSETAIPVDSDSSQIVAWVSEAVYSMADFVTYLDRSAPAVDRTQIEQVLGAADNFVTEMSLQQTILKLETEDNDFGQTMREFTSGLLLFRLMEDSVWSAAINDSLGLVKQYTDHPDMYRFGDRTRVISFVSKSETALDAIVSEIRSLGYAYPVVEAIRSDSLSSVRIDTTYIESSTNSVYDQVLNMPWQAIGDPVEYNNAFIALFNDDLEPARQRTFTEARALVVNDYQDVLERRLIQRLYKKYDVRVFPERLESRTASSQVH